MMHEPTPLRIGDVAPEPWRPPPTVLGPPLVKPGSVTEDNPKGEPDFAWFILRCAPQKDLAAVFRLTLLGVDVAWIATEMVERAAKGGGTVQRVRRLAPGYVFTGWSRQPRWHLLKELSRETVTGVVCIGDEPWEISENTLAQMKQAPERIEEMRRQEEAKREAERLANQPAPGEPARLLVGPLAGKVVLIEEVRAGRATFDIAGIKGSAAVTDLERVA